MSAPAGAPARKAPARPAGGPQEPARRDPLLGSTLGRCRIDEYIGHGRTSVVYKAHHEALDATVAIKVLMARSAARPELVKRFQTEARAVARIDNENVLKIYDVGTEGAHHFIVMELLVGEELLDLVTRDGRMEVMDALRVIRQAANGLAAAHAMDIIHRDIKPQNLFLLEDGTVKVVDFGLAAVGEDEQERVGTPHFMAPETCESGVTSAPSDIYSLGITLYHLLVGQPPYAGKEVKDILRAHLAGEPLRPERRRPGLPKEVCELVRQMTAKDPAARPTAGQVIEALDTIGGEALQEKGTLRRRRARMRSRIESRKQASVVPMILALVVVIGALAAIVALSSGGSEPEAVPPKERSEQPRLPIVPNRTPPEQPGLPSTTPPVPPSETPGPDTPTDPDTPKPPGPMEEDQETLANKALYAAEVWARRNWKTPDDDEGVLDQYRQIVESYPKSSAALEARRRIMLIQSGKLHPHPDKKFSDAESVEAAKREWNLAKPKVEELIRQHRYLEASGLVPRGMDGRGAIGKELYFWRTFLDHLHRFRSGLGTWVPKLEADRRTIETEKGTGVVSRLTAQHLDVRIEGTVQKVLWTEVKPEVLVKLALRAFQKAPAEQLLYAMAFAFAHRIWDPFWEVSYELDMADEEQVTPEMLRMKKQYEARVDERR